VSLTLADLARHADAKLIGDGQYVIHGVGTLQGAAPGSISFLSNSRYRKYLQITQASAVILQEQDLEYCPVNALVVDNPYLAYARIAALFAPRQEVSAGIHHSAIISPSARVDETASIGPLAVIGDDCVVGPRATIGPGCVLEQGVSVGNDTRLVANVTICWGCRIGARGLIHAGVVIGTDGFGLARERDVYIKVPQLGIVDIGDDVEVGANTTIDRGTIENTIIENGVKLDNQIQIGHNVMIGSNTVIVACSAIAGSTVIGKNCTLAGGVGLVGHIELADGVTITGMSMVTKSLNKPGVYSSGTPLSSSEQWHKNAVRFRQLDDMARRLKQLEKELATLKKG